MDFFGVQDAILWYKDMVPKIDFDKTAFVKLKISNKFNKTLTKQIQNNQNSIGKSYQPMEFKNLKEKIHKLRRETFAKSLWFKIKKSHRLGYGFKNL